MLEYKKVPANTVITYYGQDAGCSYILLKGEIDVWRLAIRAAIIRYIEEEYLTSVIDVLPTEEWEHKFPGWFKYEETHGVEYSYEMFLKHI